MRMIILTLAVVVYTQVSAGSPNEECYSRAVIGKYHGCYNNSLHDWVLRGDSKTSQINSVPYCRAFCAQRGYRYAGVEYNIECYCGNVIHRDGRKPDSECDYKCSGSDETCGGFWRMSVYSTSVDDMLSSHESYVRYLGCYDDMETERTLGDYTENVDKNTVPKCVEICLSKGFLYAGVENHRECHCSNRVKHWNKLKESECNTKCTGSDDMCGGDKRISIFLSATQHFNGVYMGCFEDTVKSRILPNVTDNLTDNNNLTSCLQHCAKKGYKYAGLEFRYECHCSNEVRRWIKRPESECNTKCAAKGSRDMCGGNLRIAVFSMRAEDTLSFDNSYLGCFEDSRAGVNKTLKEVYETSDTNSVTFCRNLCSKRGYKYAGMEYHRECYCGNEMKLWHKRPDSDCNTKCSGSKEMCGGDTRISIYLSNDDEIPVKNTQQFSYNKDCQKCSCQWNGSTYLQACTKIECPKLNCAENMQTKETGQCCPTCQTGCLVEGIGYVANGVNIESTDPCETCHCGQVKGLGEWKKICSRLTCRTDCPNGRVDDGTCCGKCKECDPKKCPVLQCKEKHKFQTSDMCCPVCRCRYYGKDIMEGPFGDKCEGCVCENGHVNCTPILCPHNESLKCVDATREDNCCYRCPNGETCQLPDENHTVLKKGNVKVVRNRICQCSQSFWYPYAFCTYKRVANSTFSTVHNFRRVIAPWYQP